MFDELVEKGEFIEMAVGEKRKELMDKAGMPGIQMPDLHMDERIAKMRSRLMRGEEVADDEGYDLGKGAGFYVNATQDPWKPHFQMWDYIT